MGLSGKLEAQTEIKASPAKFRNMLSHRPHHVSKASPGKIQDCILHEGEWGTANSVIECKYVLDGKACVAKEVVEAIDEEKHLVTFKVVGGDLMEEYKSFKITSQATPKRGAAGGTWVKWTFEYEKVNDTVRDPTSLLQFLIHVTADVDGHLAE